MYINLCMYVCMYVYRGMYVYRYISCMHVCILRETNINTKTHTYTHANINTVYSDKSVGDYKYI